MSILDACSTWLDTLILVAWQFVQSPEGTQAIAFLGGAIVLLDHLRRGAFPGGRVLALLLLAILAAGLWGLVALTATALDENAGRTCSASPLLHKVARKSAN